jgi:hypothetical protein
MSVQDGKNRHKRAPQLAYKTRELFINSDRRDYRVTHAPRHWAHCSAIAAKPLPSSAPETPQQITTIVQ